MIGFDNEAENRHDIILTDTAVDGGRQAVFAFYHVAQRRQITQLVFEQIDFAFFQSREHDAEFIFRDRGCRVVRRQRIHNA
ncbi:hypothetical protein D3C80_1435250 [compost metagenome]